MAEWKRGDRVLIPAMISAPTNEREPNGRWWVEIDGLLHAVAVDETVFEETLARGGN